MLSFQANVVSIEYNENGVLILAFAQMQDGSPQNYFLIQDSDDDDERETSLGTETYYLERYEQGYSSFGGIASLHVSPTKLTIVLDETGKRKLKVSSVEIGYDLTAEEYTNLKGGFEQVFGGKSYFVAEQ